MSRLTTNKPVDEMSMLELAYNSCYAENGNARYRDFEMDMDARDFARNLMVTLTGEELPIDDEAFDEEMHDNLQYDQFSSVKGLIALFYRNLWAMADLRETLKGYEDKEEQGALKVGDTLYINDFRCDWQMKWERPYEVVVLYIVFGPLHDYIDVLLEDGTKYQFYLSEIGKTVFLTRSEAEEALAKMGGSHEDTD